MIQNQDLSIDVVSIGGSDTTAVALASALKGKYEIYTDVQGIYTVDPRFNSQVRKLDNIAYDEMLEISSLDANVLETWAVEMTHKLNVPLYVAKSHVETVGTYITNRSVSLETPAITGISIDNGFC